MNWMSIKRWKEKSSWRQVLWLTVCAVIFLFVIYAAVYHDQDLWNFWLPTRQLNDDVIYSRQMAGILSDGQPRGYFGYNETHASVGHFGAWGPVLIYLYAIPGLLVGTGVNAMFWCNVLFAIAGWVIFAYGAKLTGKQQVFFAVLAGCLWTAVQQVFTGTAEPVLYFLILVIVGASVSLQRNWSIKWYVLLAVACFLITVVRAYTVLFWIFPILVLWKRRSKWAIASAALAVFSIIGYFVVTAWCNAPYYEGIDVDYTAFQLLFEGHGIRAVVYEIKRILQQMKSMWGDYLNPMLNGWATEQAIAFLGLLFLIATTLLSVVIDIRRKRNVQIRVYALLCACTGLLAMFAFYSVSPMSRHCTMLGIVLLAACVYEYRGVWWIALLSVVFLGLLPKSLELNPLPTYDAQMDAQIQTVSTALEKAMESNDSDDPWEYTLAYAFGEDVFHGYLYAVPAGMGIQFDRRSYLRKSENPIYSKYVMVGHDTETEDRLLTEGWQELVSTEDLVVYERPDDVQ